MKSGKDCRIVFVCSEAHQKAKYDVMLAEQGKSIPYDPESIYNNTKLFQVCYLYISYTLWSSNFHEYKTMVKYYGDIGGRNDKWSFQIVLSLCTGDNLIHYMKFFIRPNFPENWGFFYREEMLGGQYDSVKVTIFVNRQYLLKNSNLFFFCLITRITPDQLFC